MIEIDTEKEMQEELTRKYGKPKPLIPTPEQFEKDFQWNLELNREFNYKNAMSEINAGNCYVSQKI